ncbi:MAG: hypothetical protein CFH06_00859 [Alphaproteobacteria bacterium MarineAlpha3_Bin5]|nr:MAG: hypothetical protein CFH06_00859 [Alphaproteobacteria bacterium MarineAlpha3_Bin5]
MESVMGCEMYSGNIDPFNGNVNGPVWVHPALPIPDEYS